MSILAEINQHSNGAKFRRADLHIHSFGEGGSYDVVDAGMTPEAIVDTAVAENLQVIGITDHNVIGNHPPPWRERPSRHPQPWVHRHEGHERNSLHDFGG